MRVALFASLIAFSSGCLSTPGFEDILDGGIDAAVPNLCDKCAFPPTDWDEGGLALQAAVTANMDGNTDQDLVVGNGPVDSKYWGFFLIKDVPQQQQQVVAETFVNTDIRPQSIAVDRLGSSSRVFVVGTPASGTGTSMRVYEFSNIASSFEDLVSQRIDSAETFELGDLPRLLIAVGEFDGLTPSPARDVLIAGSDRIMFRFCNQNGACPGLLTDLVPDPAAPGALADDNGVPSDIRGLEARPSPFPVETAFRSFFRQGVDDVLVSASGEARWFTYSKDGAADPAPGWISVDAVANTDSSPSIMSVMTTSNSVEIEGTDPNFAESIFAGVGQLDFMTYNDGGDSSVAPVERISSTNPILDGGIADDDKLVIRSVATRRAGNETNLVYLAKPVVGGELKLYVDTINGFGGGGWTSTADSTAVSIEANQLSLIQTGTVGAANLATTEAWMFAADGSCECIEITTQSAITPTFGPCASNRTCGAP